MWCSICSLLYVVLNMLYMLLSVCCLVCWICSMCVLLYVVLDMLYMSLCVEVPANLGKLGAV